MFGQRQLFPKALSSLPSQIPQPFPRNEALSWFLLLSPPPSTFLWHQVASAGRTDKQRPGTDTVTTPRRQHKYARSVQRKNRASPRRAPLLSSTGTNCLPYRKCLSPEGSCSLWHPVPFRDGSREVLVLGSRLLTPPKKRVPGLCLCHPRCPQEAPLVCAEPRSGAVLLWPAFGSSGWQRVCQNLPGTLEESPTHFQSESECFFQTRRSFSKLFPNFSKHKLLGSCCSMGPRGGRSPPFLSPLLPLLFIPTTLFLFPVCWALSCPQPGRPHLPLHRGHTDHATVSQEPAGFERNTT